jgi:hypothetical protein
MIGSESFVVHRPNQFYYSGVGGTDKVISVQPPTGGSYLRLECVGTPGNVTITGTCTDGSTTETILSTSFDSEKVAFPLKKFLTLTKFTSASLTSLTIYPATESGERLKLSSYTSFSILADCYDRFLSEQSGQYTEFAGFRNKTYKTLMYDGRFTLQKGDLITILGDELVVADVSSQHGLWSSLLVSTRGK